MTDPTRSDNPSVRIVAHNTSPKQPDAITAQKVKLHATHGSLDVDRVDELLAEGAEAGELEEVADDVFRVTE